MCTDKTWTEDRAPRGGDPSAGPGAGMAGGVFSQSPHQRLIVMGQAILAAMRSIPGARGQRPRIQQASFLFDLDHID